jgi:capsular polysaccharide export protein
LPCLQVLSFPRWRRYLLEPLLQGVYSEWEISFDRTTGASEAVAGSKTLIWAGMASATDTAAADVRIEDGFIRSVGLGSDLIRPQSVVLDGRGIYFDATRPSDLEHLLNSTQFSYDDLARAQQVRRFIVDHGITKYNTEPRKAVDWSDAPQGRQIVLVPGQVEDDASILLGCTTVRTNLGLLQEVRQARPDAFVVYKPHPDVLSGNRKGRLAINAAKRWADHIEAGTSVVSCIEAADEVHTMTSLSGFDALLRGKTVVTYGQPFYAGWGLTQDHPEWAEPNCNAFARRQRRLTIDELVAGALLRYSIYWDWTLRGYTTCEAVLNRILEERTALDANGGLQKLRVGWLRRQWRKAGVLAGAYLSYRRWP